MNNAPAVECTLFDAPAGAVRGTIAAYVPEPRGRQRIAHALLRTDAPAQISLELREQTDVAGLRTAIRTLRQFLQTAQRLDRERAVLATTDPAVAKKVR